MRDFMVVLCLGCTMSLVSSPASAQVVSPRDASDVYIPVVQFQSGGTVCFTDGFCINEGQGIPLNAFATVTQLNAVSARIDGLVSSLSGFTSQFTSQLTSITTQLTSMTNEISALNSHLLSIDQRLLNIDDDLSDAIEGVAMAAALKDAVPNDGDRFALRLNAAGFSSEFAGAIGFAANVAERARVHVNYGRSRSQNTVSGGVNLSFR